MEKDGVISIETAGLALVGTFLFILFVWLLTMLIKHCRAQVHGPVGNEVNSAINNGDQNERTRLLPQEPVELTVKDDDDENPAPSSSFKCCC